MKEGGRWVVFGKDERRWKMGLGLRGREGKAQKGEDRRVAPSDMGKKARRRKEIRSNIEQENKEHR